MRTWGLVREGVSVNVFVEKSIRCREVFGLSQLQPAVSPVASRHRLKHRPIEFLDEREAVPEGRKELRRTNSDIQSVIRASRGHIRSQSAWDFVGTKYSIRRTSDSVQHCSQGSFSSESSSSRSLSQTGRSSRLAELPERPLRHSPEYRLEAVSSPVTDFSRLFDQSSNEDVDAAEIQRINFERSKKLIPMIQTRNTPKGRRSSKSPLTPLGKTSPIAVTHSMAKMEVASALPSVHKNERTIDRSNCVAQDTSKELDRDTFFKSLIKNKTKNEHQTRPVMDSPKDVDAVVAIVEKKEDFNFCVPPSDEEEAFLRSLGWNDSEEVDLLTDEEIAAFKAQYMNKTMSLSASTSKAGHRSSQCSPNGHFSSFDLIADSGSEFLSSDTD